MNSSAWLHYYQQNRLNRPEPHWELPPPPDTAALRELARSLSHFQLGESGEGTYLLRQAQRTHAGDPAYCAALALFIQEEQEHGTPFAKTRRALPRTARVQALDALAFSQRPSRARCRV